jgi:hypothetical protein
MVYVLRHRMIVPRMASDVRLPSDGNALWVKMPWKARMAICARIALAVATKQGVATAACLGSQRIPAGMLAHDSDISGRMSECPSQAEIMAGKRQHDRPISPARHTMRAPFFIKARSGFAPDLTSLQ